MAEILTPPRDGLPTHYRSVIFTDITRVAAKQKALGELIACENVALPPLIDEYDRNQIIRRIGAYLFRRSYSVRLADVLAIVRKVIGWRTKSADECKAVIGKLWPEICEHSERLERQKTVSGIWTLPAIRKAEIRCATNPRSAFFGRHSMSVAGDTLADYRRYVAVNGRILVTRKSNGQTWRFDTETCRLHLITDKAES